MTQPPPPSPFPLPYSPPFLPSLPIVTLPFPPLEVGPLKSSKWVWESAASSLSGVGGGAPAEIEFGAL